MPRYYKRNQSLADSISDGTSAAMNATDRLEDVVDLDVKHLNITEDDLPTWTKPLSEDHISDSQKSIDSNDHSPTTGTINTALHQAVAQGHTQFPGPMEYELNFQVIRHLFPPTSPGSSQAHGSLGGSAQSMQFSDPKSPCPVQALQQKHDNKSMDPPSLPASFINRQTARPARPLGPLVKKRKQDFDEDTESKVPKILLNGQEMEWPCADVQQQAIAKSPSEECSADEYLAKQKANEMDPTLANHDGQFDGTSDDFVASDKSMTTDDTVMANAAPESALASQSSNLDTANEHASTHGKMTANDAVMSNDAPESSLELHSNQHKSTTSKHVSVNEKTTTNDTAMSDTTPTPAVTTQSNQLGGTASESLSASEQVIINDAAMSNTTQETTFELHGNQVEGSKRVRVNERIATKDTAMFNATRDATESSPATQSSQLDATNPALVHADINKTTSDMPMSIANKSTLSTQNSQLNATSNAFVPADKTMTTDHVVTDSALPSHSTKLSGSTNVYVPSTSSTPTDNAMPMVPPNTPDRSIQLPGPVTPPSQIISDADPTSSSPSTPRSPYQIPPYWKTDLGKTISAWLADPRTRVRSNELDSVKLCHRVPYQPTGDEVLRTYCQQGGYWASGKDKVLVRLYEDTQPKLRLLRIVLPDGEGVVVAQPEGTTGVRDWLVLEVEDEDEEGVEERAWRVVAVPFGAVTEVRGGRRYGVHCLCVGGGGCVPLAHGTEWYAADDQGMGAWVEACGKGEGVLEVETGVGVRGVWESE